MDVTRLTHQQNKTEFRITFIGCSLKIVIVIILSDTMMTKATYTLANNAHALAGRKWHCCCDLH
jgi:hypothetical protein